MTLRAASHLVLATADVPAITRFFAGAFGVAPAFENDMFSEFVLPSKFRIAFFKPVGASAQKSFLLTDPDGNRWEITQSPSADGLLVDL